MGRTETDMARKMLPKNASLRFLVESNRLRDPDKYLSRVLNNMISFQQRFETAAVVRIGTTGEGRAPHYRVEPQGLDVMDEEIFSLGNDSTQEEQARLRARTLAAHYTAYNGASHKTLSWGRDELQKYSWSDNSTSVQGVRALIAKVRGLPAVRSD